MNTLNLKNKLGLLGVALLIATVSFAATKGDPIPFGKNGVVQIVGFDGGTTAPVCLAISSQNTIMVRNVINDGGTSQTMYCGFDTSVSRLTGMPVLAGETLSVDITAVAQPTHTLVDPLAGDGGQLNVGGAALPQLCCVQAAGTSPSDLHWLIVK